MEKLTPHVFISAASDDLRSARHVVKDALLSLGCHPIVQEHFEPDYRTVEDMIRSRVEGCQAVVHLIGKRYGGEPSPKSLPEGTPRRSWTQMEHAFAKALGVKVYLFVCDDDYPFDHQPLPEPDDEVRLQAEYRQKILGGDQLYTIVKSPEELALRISEMRLEAAELRKAVAEARNQLSDALGVVEDGQAQILASIADLSQSFTELSTLGGIIAKPTSPEHFYSNARLFELRSDYGNARRAYLDYFRFDLDFLDPYLRFQQFLKVQEGREGAREAFNYVAAGSKGTIAKMATSLLLDRQARVAQLREYLATHPEFGPAHYLLSRDYSIERLGGQTLLDKVREKTLLDDFNALDAAGKVGRWILDKSALVEWREDATARLAVLAKADYAMKTPLSVMWMSHNAGWTGTVQIAEPAKEIFWRKKDEAEFESTGFYSQAPGPSGYPIPTPTIEMHRKAPKTDVEIKYINVNGETMGPYTAAFQPDEASLLQTKSTLNMTKTAWVAFREFDGRLLLYFTHLLCYAEVKRIRYGLDADTPTIDYPVPEREGVGAIGIGEGVECFIEVPLATQTACVQVTFDDGEETDVEVFYR